MFFLVLYYVGFLLRSVSRLVFTLSVVLRLTRNLIPYLVRLPLYDGFLPVDTR